MAQDSPTPEFDIVKMASTFLPFIILWGWGKLNLDTTDPVILWSIRGFYVLSQLITFGLVFALEQKIKNGANGPENAKILKYVVRRPQTTVMSERATNSDVEEFEYQQKTVADYDLEQAAQLKALLPIAITLGIHFYFGAIQPLVIQAFSGPLRLLENKEIKIHFLGQDLERPFYPDPSPFAGLLGTRSDKELMDEWDQAQQSKGGKKAKQATVISPNGETEQITEKKEKKDKKNKKTD